MTDEAAPVVTITAAEMYGELRGLRESVHRIEGKLDGIAAITGELEDHEERIRHLEANRWPWPTITALVAVAALVLSAWEMTH
ncbi:hypothetical protein SSP35_03_02980 [Streptomyces sp. NBRC 110611]|uniref:hypothetical protein n=1 Tax=Streptomyces sp. NBRC 110611 TaxID=1621259 RepID=UPI000855CC1E|nr:hypothetical protein [Streptomyces sp. NBRC 110611]GAU66650.1 hypothetical protein SSP35_03_02980 [Streptomyces sp. NBRC 110611]